ncbi:MAG: DNA adenine methylase [Chloroflexota bacterium]
MSHHAFLQALPAYLGGKRRLAPLIFATLAEVLPRAQWAGSTLLDPMCGGGAISLYAKAQGFSVIASDLAERGALTARALIANSNIRLRIDDILDLYAEPDGDYPRIAAAHVPQVFNEAQAAFVDNALARANRRPEPLRSLLQLVVVKTMLRFQPLSMLSATDAGAAATGDYDRLTASRLRHYLRADRLLLPSTLWSIAQEVNAGVFGGSGEASRGNAVTMITGTTADIVYLDPPYPGTTGYHTAYGVLDELLGDTPIASAVPLSLTDLLQAAEHIPLLVLSFGGPRVTLDQLREQVGQHRDVLRAIAVPYPHLRSVASEAHRVANRELIIIAG